MAVLIIFELLTLWFAIQTLSSVRAVVGAEGLWSKAQKDAVYHLGRYYRTHNIDEYDAFRKFMTVPLGDHKARLELMKKDPDLEIARNGFIEGRVHPDDVDGIIRLFRNFANVYYIDKAVRIWSEGDSVIFQLMAIAEKIKIEISSGNPSKSSLDQLMEQLNPINQKLTKLEDDFSYTLGEGSRWLENLILKLLFIVALTVEITGLFLTFLVSRKMTKDLNEIKRVTTMISKGDLSARVNVQSKDEIGHVASTVNQMTEKLVFSYRELEQFAYIASHDLQEPLRTISNYSSLFHKQYYGKIDETADKYLHFINRATLRMQSQIKAILDYSRIGHDKEFTLIDCNLLVNSVLYNLEKLIQESNAIIKVSSLPVIYGYNDLDALFLNLLSNSIKFRDKSIPPRIEINCESVQSEWVFSIKDNGIGIEKQYFDRIFTIFQKLHSPNDFPGTGIGLAHCKKIVEMHGGKIWVTSEYKKGSTFYFSIPKTINQ